MGIHDRPYYSDSLPSGLAPSWNQRSIVINLIIINAVLYIANMFFGDDFLTNSLALRQNDLQRPWLWWHLLSYGFVHSPSDPFHILFNMFSLYSLGRSVEERYGRIEFLAIYLLATFLGGLAFWFTGSGSVVGASGAVCCIVMLFVFNYPQAQLALMGVIQVPAWVLGVILVATNLLSAPHDHLASAIDPAQPGLSPPPSSGGIAYQVHLAGIGLATAYFFLQWNLSNLFASFNLRQTRRRWLGPTLKVHQPTTNRDDAEADRILQKIHEHGQDSLSRTERKFMQNYSKRIRARRSQDADD